MQLCLEALSVFEIHRHLVAIEGQSLGPSNRWLIIEQSLGKIRRHDLRNSQLGSYAGTVFSPTDVSIDVCLKGQGELGFHPY
jgi:hypothetical protein